MYLDAEQKTLSQTLLKNQELQSSTPIRLPFKQGHKRNWILGIKVIISIRLLIPMENIKERHISQNKMIPIIKLQQKFIKQESYVLDKLFLSHIDYTKKMNIIVRIEYVKQYLLHFSKQQYYSYFLFIPSA